MSTEIRRVPLDFDWPLGTIWGGYLMPADLDLPACPDCRYDGSATGYSREAWPIASTFYPHMIGHGPGAEQLAWYDKISQAEVDHLLAEGRLRTMVKREPTADNPRIWGWVSLPRTAAEVNAAQHTKGLNGHDGINRMILIEFRCERLGIPVQCPTCHGECRVGTPEQVAAHDAWAATEPPTGEGWQAWETVTEGSPISPVFDSPDGLVDWFTTDFYRPLTRREAEALVNRGASVGCGIITDAGVIQGEEAVAALEARR